MSNQLLKEHPLINRCRPWVNHHNMFLVINYRHWRKQLSPGFLKNLIMFWDRYYYPRRFIEKMWRYINRKKNAKQYEEFVSNVSGDGSLRQKQQVKYEKETIGDK